MRIRSIKPELWTSEQIVCCSRDARLLFIGLFNFCDDAGIAPASPLRLKMQVLPGDNCTAEEIKVWLDELMRNDLIIEYEVEGKRYWQVTGWSRHQRIDKPTYRYPKPDKTSHSSQKINNSLSVSMIKFDELSTTNRQSLDEISTTESNGMERNGNKDICEADASLACNEINFGKVELLEIFEHWKKVMSKPKAKLDSKRVGKINQALKLGYSVEDLKLAITGCSKSAFHMGDNSHKRKYDDLSLILRDCSHIESFINLNTPAIDSALQNNSSIFAGAI